MTEEINAVAVRQDAAPLVTFTPAQLALMKRTIAENATDDEFALFVGQAKRTALDPFTRQIYFIKGKKRRDGTDGKVSIVVSIDGFRLIAERSGKYRGQVPTQWCGDDGVWVDVWLEVEPPSAARVGVLRSGFDQPLYAVAVFREVAKYEDEWVGQDGNRRKTGNKILSQQWFTQPAHMLAKVAEALALRKAFPNDLSGLYTGDEMGEAITVEAIEKEAPKKNDEPNGWFTRSAVGLPPQPVNPKKTVSELLAGYREELNACSTEGDIDDTLMMIHEDAEMTETVWRVVMQHAKARKALVSRK